MLPCAQTRVIPLCRPPQTGHAEETTRMNASNRLTPTKRRTPYTRSRRYRKKDMNSVPLNRLALTVLTASSAIQCMLGGAR